MKLPSKESILSVKEGFFKLDHNLSSRIRELNHHYFSAILLIPSMMFGSYGMWLTILSSYYFVGYSREQLILLICGSLFTLLVTTTGKTYIDRGRPRRRVEKLINIRYLESNNAFPSGDTAQAFCLWAFFMVIKNRQVADKMLWLAITCAIGRVYFACHFVTDVIAGFVAGSTAMWVVHLGIQWLGLFPPV